MLQKSLRIVSREVLQLAAFSSVNALVIGILEVLSEQAEQFKTQHLFDFERTKREPLATIFLGLFLHEQIMNTHLREDVMCLLALVSIFGLDFKEVFNVTMPDRKVKSKGSRLLICIVTGKQIGRAHV